MANRPVLLAERSFSLDDQQLFAELSGDWNPLHLDSVVARRSMFGQPVVHGVHAFLWALGAFLTHRSVGVSKVSVSFRKPMLIDERIGVWLTSDDPQRSELQVRRRGLTLLVAKLDLAEPATVPRISGGAQPSASVDRATPRELDVGDISARSGCLPLASDFDRLWEQFSEPTRRLGPGVVSSLMALSRLVGMECPGLHSLFSGFVANLTVDDAAELAWSVERFDDRVGAVRMSVASDALEGSVDAFVRPRPAAQQDSAELRSIVTADEFAGVRALVVGGSRGLGELSAKLVAAGGGQVALTWHRGASDAAGVVDDICVHGGMATSLQLDVANDHDLPPLFGGAPVTHLFYFATPQIFARRTSTFDQQLFSEFSDVYVAGFSRVVESLTRGGGDLVAFYPSTVAIDEDRAELREYAAAKAAGESVARSLGAAVKGLSVMVERLPRLPTDQTATILAVPTAEPVDVMLEVVRRATAR